MNTISAAVRRQGQGQSAPEVRRVPHVLDPGYLDRRIRSDRSWFPDGAFAAGKRSRRSDRVPERIDGRFRIQLHRTGLGRRFLDVHLGLGLGLGLIVHRGLFLGCPGGLIAQHISDRTNTFSQGLSTLLGIPDHIDQATQRIRVHALELLEGRSQKR